MNIKISEYTLDKICDMKLNYINHTAIHGNHLATIMVNTKPTNNINTGCISINTVVRDHEMHTSMQAQGCLVDGMWVTFICRLMVCG